MVPWRANDLDRDRGQRLAENNIGKVDNKRRNVIGDTVEACLSVLTHKAMEKMLSKQVFFRWLYSAFLMSNYLLKFFVITSNCLLLEWTFGPMDIFILAKFLLFKLFGLRITKTLRWTTRMIRRPDVRKGQGRGSYPTPTSNNRWLIMHGRTARVTAGSCTARRP